MTRCQNCGEKWTFEEKLKESFKFTFDRHMTCPHCQSKQYQTHRHRKISALISFLMVLAMFIPSFLSAPWQVYVTTVVTVVPVAFFLMVHTYELSNTDEGDFWHE
ncbi:TIGR04104 family putative zinc finger protein [Salinicoccus hispanicus]|uniref:CXXC-20-CXXC protein n=1 Tax=Salinicoccus hispanicus TaxID=157225 RepID=A0A6N8U305_9STAP|nr:hypothetical protein [Salinicoccus hispanicus]